MSSLSQLLCTHCTYGSCVFQRATGDMAKQPLGYNVRAATPGAQNLQQDYLHLEHFLAYSLPSDVPVDAKMKMTARQSPPALFYHPDVHEKSVVGQVVYRQTDTYGRLGSYFGHLIYAETNITPAFTAREALKLYQAPGWVLEDSADLPLDLAPLAELGELRHDTKSPLSHSQVANLIDIFLKKQPGPTSPNIQEIIPQRLWKQTQEQRKALLAEVVQTIVEALDQSATVLLVAEPGLAAFLYAATLRLLPKGTAAETMSFSTFESQWQSPRTQVAATWFDQPTAHDVADTKYADSSCYVFNTFTGRRSVKKASGGYARYLLDLWLKRDLAEVDAQLNMMAADQITQASALEGYVAEIAQCELAQQQGEAIFDHNYTSKYPQTRFSDNPRIRAALQRGVYQAVTKLLHSGKVKGTLGSDAHWRVLDALQLPVNKEIETVFNQYRDNIPDDQLHIAMRHEALSAKEKIVLLKSYFNKHKKLPPTYEKELWSSLQTNQSKTVPISLAALVDVLSSKHVIEWVTALPSARQKLLLPTLLASDDTAFKQLIADVFLKLVTEADKPGELQRALVELMPSKEAAQQVDAVLASDASMRFPTILSTFMDQWHHTPSLADLKTSAAAVNWYPSSLAAVEGYEGQLKHWNNFLWYSERLQELTSREELDAQAGRQLREDTDALIMCYDKTLPLRFSEERNKLEEEDTLTFKKLVSETYVESPTYSRKQLIEYCVKKLKGVKAPFPTSSVKSVEPVHLLPTKDTVFTILARHPGKVLMVFLLLSVPVAMYATMEIFNALNPAQSTEHAAEIKDAVKEKIDKQPVSSKPVVQPTVPIPTRPVEVVAKVPPVETAKTTPAEPEESTIGFLDYSTSINRFQKLEASAGALSNKMKAARDVVEKDQAIFKQQQQLLKSMTWELVPSAGKSPFEFTLRNPKDWALMAKSSTIYVELPDNLGAKSESLASLFRLYSRGGQKTETNQFPDVTGSRILEGYLKKLVFGPIQTKVNIAMESSEANALLGFTADYHQELTKLPFREYALKPKAEPSENKKYADCADAIVSTLAGYGTHKYELEDCQAKFSNILKSDANRPKVDQLRASINQGKGEAEKEFNTNIVKCRFYLKVLDECKNSEANIVLCNRATIIQAFHVSSYPSPFKMKLAVGYDKQTWDQGKFKVRTKTRNDEVSSCTVLDQEEEIEIVVSRGLNRFELSYSTQEGPEVKLALAQLEEKTQPNFRYQLMIDDKTREFQACKFAIEQWNSWHDLETKLNALK